jgi:hypothetical protein
MVEGYQSLSDAKQIGFDEDNENDSDGSSSSGQPDRWAANILENQDGSEGCENLFLDNDVDEDDLLDGVFDSESVEMLKSKACMLCTQDFGMFSGSKNC